MDTQTCRRTPTHTHTHKGHPESLLLFRGRYAHAHTQKKARARERKREGGGGRGGERGSISCVCLRSLSLCVGESLSGGERLRRRGYTERVPLRGREATQRERLRKHTHKHTHTQHIHTQRLHRKPAPVSCAGIVQQSRGTPTTLGRQ